MNVASIISISHSTRRGDLFSALSSRIVNDGYLAGSESTTSQVYHDNLTRSSNTYACSSVPIPVLV